MSGKLENWEHCECSHHFPKVSPNFTKSGTIWVHCGYIPNVPLGNISGTPFWFILGFTGWGHCNHTFGETAKNTLNEPLGNTVGTSLGYIWSVPINFLIGKPQSHDWVHCKCTEHFLGQGNCGEIGWENSGWTWDVPGGYVLGTLAISLQWICIVPTQAHRR